MIDFIKKLFKPKTPKIFYKVLGEEEGVYQLVKNFYDIMESHPNAKECLETHELIDNKIPDEVKKKLFMFLCGWLGGPNLFVKTYGAPRMRARHMHISISQKERDQWLFCMKEALKIHPFKLSRSEKKTLNNSFMALALRIQNKN